MDTTINFPLNDEQLELLLQKFEENADRIVEIMHTKCGWHQKNDIFYDDGSTSNYTISENKLKEVAERARYISKTISALRQVSQALEKAEEVESS